MNPHIFFNPHKQAAANMLLQLWPLLFALSPAAAVRGPITYRKATPTEHRAVGELRTAVFCPELRSVGSLYMQTRVFIDSMASKSAVLVAVGQCEDGTVSVVGSADLRVEDVRHIGPAAAGGDSVGYITNVCVCPSARRRGVGRSLMRLAESVCVEERATELLLHVEPHNTAAAEMYRVLGFSERKLGAVTDHFYQMPFYDPEAPPQTLLVLHPQDPGSVPPRAPLQDAATEEATEPACGARARRGKVQQLRVEARLRPWV